ncbi:siphovirus ReqiPepy6 Gp37-like family protein [Pseudomonadales bacterium]|nr:siphovirus ReqiPepy6 Gp37-like family protein [Pseudomonadales bacterium]
MNIRVTRRLNRLGTITASICEDDAHLIEPWTRVLVLCTSDDGDIETVFDGFLIDRRELPTSIIGRLSVGSITWTGYSSEVLLSNAYVTQNYCKLGAADDVLAEYIREAIGQDAPNGDCSIGQTLTVGSTRGCADEWEGCRQYENLLDTATSIANAYGIDFTIEGNENCEYNLTIHCPQIGIDRTTGANALILSPKFENIIIQAFSTIDSETRHIANITIDGEIVYTGCVEDLDKIPNVCRAELAPIDGSAETTELGWSTLAREALAQNSRRVDIRFDLNQTGLCYGKDLRLGDRFPVRYRGETFNYRNTGYTFVSEGGFEGYASLEYSLI